MVVSAWSLQAELQSQLGSHFVLVRGLVHILVQALVDSGNIAALIHQLNINTHAEVQKECAQGISNAAGQGGEHLTRCDDTEEFTVLDFLALVAD